MKPFSLFTSVLVASYMCFVDGQQPCTHAGQPGTCKILEQCAPLYALLIKPNKSQQDIDQLRSAHCGFENRKPKVCCTADCLTPDNQRGTCVGVYSCANLANLLTPDISNEAKTFLQRSRCNGPEQYSVCCGPRAPIFNLQPATPTTSIVPVANGRCMLTAYPPDPRTECCGVDSGAGNKIVGGNSTTVDQYPWLAIIEYVKDSRLKLLCGGALISGKYVLTAGHCVVGPVLQVGTPRNVRLGEYDTDNEGPDCIPVEGGGQDCTEGIVVIPIERVIPHPDYNPSNQLRRNDIALLRLRNVAPFTDFIRPICLPTSDITLRPPARFTLFAAGWGAVNESVSRSNVKLHVDLPYKSMAECQPAYNVPHRRIQFWEGQICAGGDLGKDSCKGDSGGPLMYENGRTFEVIGVVSFGPTPCGMEGIPGVYTKVYHYNSWILNQITP